MANNHQLPLLTVGPSDRRTVGPTAGLALLDTRLRGATFHEVPVKAILNSPATTGMGFWSLNPYVGCEFGCTYCYARETHRWVMEKTVRRSDGPTVRGGGSDGQTVSEQVPSARRGIDPQTEPTVGPSDRRTVSEKIFGPQAEPPVGPSDRRTVALPAWLAFEKQILVKTSAAHVLKRTLFPAKLAGASLVIGTATDPYQPAERRFRLTRQILEALLGWRGLSLGIITKSPLILRDRDILVQLAERHDLTVNISLSSADRALLRRIEARSPAPHARLRALKGLTDAGIHAGLLVAPILPALTDSRESLEALLQAARAAGARYVVGFPLRVGPVTRARLLPHIAEEFPELAERYQRHFSSRDTASPEYTAALSARFKDLQRKYGFSTDSSMSGSKRRYQRASVQTAIGAVNEQWSLL